jgi:very-short-patch-repair endonuclease
MKKLWKKEEVDLLIKLYEIDGLSVTELYPLFNKFYNRPIDGLKVKIGRLKLRHTKEQVKKIKSRLNSGELNAMFGKQSPMKGLTSKTSEIVRFKSVKTSETRKEMFKNGELQPLTGSTNPMYGSISWNNGLDKYTDKRIFNYGEKISKIKKKEWENKTDDEKKEIIVRLNNAMIQTKKPTKIENKIENFLIENEIKYVKNKRYNLFIFDFYLIEFNFVIECDGDYWHANPLFYNGKKLTDAQIKNIERDKRKNLLLKSNLIDFVRFWEFDIKNNFEIIKKTIWEKLQKR